VNASIPQRELLRRFKVRGDDKARAVFSLHQNICNLNRLCNLLKFVMVLV